MDGEEFVVNGQKVWMSNGMEGTHCMVLVRTDPAAPKHQGISALLIPFDTPGVERGRCARLPRPRVSRKCSSPTSVCR